MERNQLKVPQDLYNRNTRVFETGEFIFREAEPGDTMFIVLSGQVEILKRTTRGANRQLALLNQGDIFGEMSLLDTLPRSASAVAKERTEVLAIQEDGFEKLLARNPQFGIKLMKSLSKKLRTANKVISDFSFSLNKWVLTGLQTYAKERGEKIQLGRKFARRDFEKWASLHLGITVRELYPVLTHLRRAGMLWVSGNNEEMVLKPEGQNALHP